MRWNKTPKVERPEYPKLVPVAGTIDEAEKALAQLKGLDPEASILDGGSRGAYIKVHNEAAEAAARAEVRNFPIR